MNFETSKCSETVSGKSLTTEKGGEGFHLNKTLVGNIMPEQCKTNLENIRIGINTVEENCI